MTVFTVHGTNNIISTCTCSAVACIMSLIFQ